MIIGPKYKICRRLGSGVFDQCQTQKFMASEGKKSPKASKGPRKQLSEYGMQLNEKQKIRFSYGISEKQLSNYVETATTTKGAIASEKLYELLETRLDNVIYRSGLAVTRRLARQMASHGHFLVNGVKTNVPSYHLSIGDKISVKEGSKSSVLFQNTDKKLEKFNVPAWLSLNADKLEVEVRGVPKKDDAFLDFNTVLEFYSR
ncbi:MAG: small subunit ribosomal protein [Patescibacteria group bacterium]|jgi:small subunit ribosomal protein S4|nr:small subunit ribosomal protein [Patescibacteria group bacterium]